MAYTTAEEVITNIDLYQVEEGKRSLAQIGKALAIAGVVLWVIGVIFRVATIR